MPAKRVKIEHSDIVRGFAARLREKRLALGLTQADLAARAMVTTNYVGRLESAGAAPGIDLLDRLAVALGTTPADLLPPGPAPDEAAALRKEAQRLFRGLMDSADADALKALVPLLARFAGEPVGRR